MKTFDRKLAGYGVEAITRAFDEWCDENKTFPHHSDILKLIRGTQRFNRPEYKCLPIPDRVPATEEEKAAVSEMMKEIKRNLAGGAA